jgi:hypothetical protein
MPSIEPLLTVPYISVAEFLASPTWLDLNDLIEDGSAAQQTAEQYNQILKASAWADNYIRQPLRAHYQVDNLQCRVDKLGRIFIHPHHLPVRQVVAVSYGSDLNNMTQATIGPSTAWVEDSRGIIIALSGINGAWASTLQFGSAPSPSTQVYVQVEYIAGYGHGIITANSLAGATSLSVDSTLGFQKPATSLAGNSYGGSVARIWEPALEEAGAVQGISGGALTFSAPLANAHSVGINVSELPAEVKQAVTQYAAGLLLRENATNALPFPGAPGPTTMRDGGGGVAGGLINEAEMCLSKYRRVR